MPRDDEDPMYERRRDAAKREERDRVMRERRWQEKGSAWLAIGAIIFVAGLILGAGFDVEGAFVLGLIGAWIIVIALLVRSVKFVVDRIRRR